MSRELDTKTLDAAGTYYAGQFLMPTINNPHNGDFAPIAGRGFVLASLEKLTFEDEYKYLHGQIRQNLGPKALKEFDDLISKHITPYDDGELEHELAERLAVDLHGKPIPGKIGKVQQGSIVIGFRYKQWRWIRDPDTGQKIKVPALRSFPRKIRTAIYIGETPEEAVARAIKLHQDHGEVVFPMSQWPATMMALNTRISNEAAILACDAVVDRLDEGTAAAVIQGRSGAQPADPDTAVTGTLLFTLVYSDPAFGAAADAAPGGRATASAIASDTNADATGTLGYCRSSATNDAITPLDDHIDGEAGTSGADYNFNTLAIVSGATVSLSSQTVTMPEG